LGDGGEQGGEQVEGEATGEDAGGGGAQRVEVALEEGEEDLGLDLNRGAGDGLRDVEGE
jgi:hypothetical protein